LLLAACFLKKTKVKKAGKAFHGLSGHPYCRGGDASSRLPADVYRAVFSQGHSAVEIQPAEAILSRVVFI